MHLRLQRVRTRHSLWSLLLTLVVSELLAVRSTTASDGPEWIRDVDAAREAAAVAEKDLFVLFTGHGWCANCEVLDREVFRSEDFLSRTRDEFVFVELDFTFGETEVEEQREADYRALKEKYAVVGFPNIILADDNGVPFAARTGYEVGSGPEELLKFIRAAQKAKHERDQALQSAANLSGRMRALQLDKAIVAVEPLLESMEERADDPVLLFYADQIDELLTLIDGDKDELKRKYLARQQARREWLSRDDYLAEVRKFDATGDHAGAIEFIAKSLDEVEHAGLRWRLEIAQQLQLERSDRHQEALTNCRRLLAFEDIPPDDREALLDREAFNLIQLGRLDDALMKYDGRIDSAEPSSSKRLRLIGQKAQMILPHGMKDPSRLQQTAHCWTAYRDAAEKGTEHWFTATAILARILQRDEKHNDALQLINEFLAVNRDPVVLLDALKSQVALQNEKLVASLTEEINTAIRELSQSERPSDHQQAERLQGRLTRLVGESSANEPQRESTATAE